MLNIGKDLKRNDSAQIDDSHSRAVLICGKRGSGKSYTLGVLAEELFSSSSKPLILIIDPIGIYWTMCLSDISQDKDCVKNSADFPGGSGIALKRGAQDGLNIDTRQSLPLIVNPARALKGATRQDPESQRSSSRDHDKAGLPVKVFIPGKPETRYGADVTGEMKRLGVKFQEIRINPNDLSPDQWCALFNLSINEPLGIALYRSIQHLKITGNFIIPDIIDSIQKDPLCQEKTREALLNRLEMASAWDIFSQGPEEFIDLLNEDSLNILDLSVIDPGSHGLRNLLVSILCQDLFKKRLEARRREEIKLDSRINHIWLLIDEAHQFVPQGKDTLAKESLIRWIKEGRQPGLSCAFASQQPSSLDNEVITQCDITICHKLTNNDDISAVNKLSQDYMGSELRIYIRNLKTTGEAVLVDDKNEKVSMIKIRERLTIHGGKERNFKAGGC